MNNTKEMIEREYDERYDAAAQIALAAGVLKECEYHEGFFFKGDKELRKAFAMAKDQYLQGKYDYVFRDKKDMTDSIIEIVGQYASKRCSCCGRSYEE